MNYKIVADRLRKIKKQKGVMFSYIEKATGLRCNRIRRLLWGEAPPRLSEFALLCIALGASADELLQTSERWEIIER